MQYAVALNPLIPVRIAPSERSEMSDQILFGNFFQIINKELDWSYIHSYPDNYAGWINNSNNFSLISSSVFNETIKSPQYILPNPVNSIIHDKTGISKYIPGGSILSYYNKDGTFEIFNERYQLKTSLPKKVENKREWITQLARQYINAPYLWGGKTIFGMDCSGFTQLLFKITGIYLPRDSFLQVDSGNTVSFIEQAQPGDLAFFDNKEGNITHVGLIMNNYEIIHASGRVRIDFIDHQGIYNKEEKRYTHKLRVIKNILG
jgi:hypothetical protein